MEKKMNFPVFSHSYSVVSHVNTLKVTWLCQDVSGTFSMATSVFIISHCGLIRASPQLENKRKTLIRYKLLTNHLMIMRTVDYIIWLAPSTSLIKRYNIYLMQIVFDDSRLKFSARELNVLRFESE